VWDEVGPDDAIALAPGGSADLSATQRGRKRARESGWTIAGAAFVHDVNKRAQARDPGSRTQEVG